MKKGKETPLPTPVDRHAAVVKARMAERLRDAQARAQAYESTLDPRQREMLDPD